MAVFKSVCRLLVLIQETANPGGVRASQIRIAAASLCAGETAKEDLASAFHGLTQEPVLVEAKRAVRVGLLAALVRCARDEVVRVFAVPDDNPNVPRRTSRAPDSATVATVSLAFRGSTALVAFRSRMKVA